MLIIFNILILSLCFLVFSTINRIKSSDSSITNRYPSRLLDSVSTSSILSAHWIVDMTRTTWLTVCSTQCSFSSGLCYFMLSWMIKYIDLRICRSVSLRYFSTVSSRMIAYKDSKLKYSPSLETSPISLSCSSMLMREMFIKHLVNRCMISAYCLDLANIFSNSLLDKKNSRGKLYRLLSTNSSSLNNIWSRFSLILLKS